jgi:hypothetical protein
MMRLIEVEVEEKEKKRERKTSKSVDRSGSTLEEK